MTYIFHKLIQTRLPNCWQLTQKYLKHYTWGWRISHCKRERTFSFLKIPSKAVCALWTTVQHGHSSGCKFALTVAKVEKQQVKLHWASQRDYKLRICLLQDCLSEQQSHSCSEIVFLSHIKVDQDDVTSTHCVSN